MNEGTPFEFDEWDGYFRTFYNGFKNDPTKLDRLMQRRYAQAKAIADRQAQERRAKEWRAYVKGGPVPALTDAEVERLLRDIFGGR